MRKLAKNENFNSNGRMPVPLSKHWKSRSRLVKSRKLRRSGDVRQQRKRPARRKAGLLPSELRLRLPKRKSASFVSSSRVWTTMMTPAMIAMTTVLRRRPQQKAHPHRAWSFPRFRNLPHLRLHLRLPLHLFLVRSQEAPRLSAHPFLSQAHLKPVRTHSSSLWVHPPPEHHQRRARRRLTRTPFIASPNKTSQSSSKPFPNPLPFQDALRARPSLLTKMTGLLSTAPMKRTRKTSLKVAAPSNWRAFSSAPWLHPDL